MIKCLWYIEEVARLQQCSWQEKESDKMDLKSMAHCKFYLHKIPHHAIMFIKGGNTMKVKIINCSDRDDSYKHLIGKIFDVINSNHMLCVINDDKCIYNVSINDTIPVHELSMKLMNMEVKHFAQTRISLTELGVLCVNAVNIIVEQTNQHKIVQM